MFRVRCLSGKKGREPYRFAPFLPGSILAVTLSLLLCSCASTGSEIPETEAKAGPIDSGAAANPQETRLFDEALQAAARGIAGQLPRDGKVRLAVFDFTDMDGGENECGRLLARSLETELVRQASEQGAFSLVERGNLSLILDEVKHNMSGLADESQCIQAGKQLGATALLRAAMNPWGEDRVRMIGKVMDVESARILAAFSCDVFLPKDVRSRCGPEVFPAGGRVGLVKAENPNSDYRIRVWTDKAVYQLGEPVTVYAQSNRDGYLYLFDIDSQGSKTLLLPNTYSRQHHFLAAGETFRSPAGWFSAGRPTGRGTIKAVVTPDPLPLDDPTFSDLSPGVPFRSLSRANARGVVVNTRKTEGGFGTGWITIEE